MSQISSAIGMLIWLFLPNSRPRSTSMTAGKAFPSITPATMHRTTQTGRYRSKTFIALLLIRLCGSGKPCP